MSGSEKKVAIIGAGLAGSEAALVLSSLGVRVMLYEARPLWVSPAHNTDKPAELVCSNSFKAATPPSAHGQLKSELLSLGSPLLRAAKECAVPAGGALAVDREIFSEKVLQEIERDPLIDLVREEIKEPPKGFDACIIAAGPLVSDSLAEWLKNRFSSESLNFYDAIAPIIDFDSIDMSVAFFASRRDNDSFDYINCPFSEEEYRTFYDALLHADQTQARSFEDSVFFEACLPVEIMAGRGYKCLAFGPLRPVGITDPRTGRWPYAVCQLRRENKAGDSFNMVGFQTRLTIPQQKKVFRLIPGLENAEFLRYGSIHRNTYLNSPKLLSDDLSFSEEPDLFLAGQICGNEGYTESVATGHLSALFVSRRLSGCSIEPPPLETATGALLNHVTNSTSDPFTPSNIHFGLFPALEQQRFNRKEGKKRKKQVLCERATEKLNEWAEKTGVLTPNSKHLSPEK
ncbi:tRNA:m(5)U-54 MTase gid [Chitinispirillum alkaliphilum]|nr:tRNA:m(5)U-54 MTase gid [Chitinispirillum alkaliphilum]